MNPLTDRWLRGDVPAQILVALVAAIMLFWGLGDKYLWQDEASTAVLARNLLRFGRPLAYDGKNLLTIDSFGLDDPATVEKRATSAQAAVDYQVAMHGMRPDTSWTYHPWGQFVAAAAGLALMGETTVAARAPFALAGLVTVLLLYRMARVYCASSWIAFLAASLLLFNAYWILHARQSRYYALTSLFFVMTLLAYARWQWGGRWGAAGFFLAAWCWFQVDYGTVWPVLAVLFAHAFALRRRKLWQVALTGLCLFAAIRPFYFFYELKRRSLGAGYGDLRQHLFNLNQFVVPAAVLLVALVLLARRWSGLREAERHLVLICCMCIVTLAIYVPKAAPATLVRYVIMAAPVGSLIAAWCFVRLAGARPQWAVPAAVVLALTPWLTAYPVIGDFQPFIKPFGTQTGLVIRFEIPVLFSEVFGHRPDPNRIVADWLRQNAAPSDEIVINYEDAPLMFYLPNPIRGGIAAFRVEDDSKSPPQFIVLRKSAAWVHWEVFNRELARYRWESVALNAPDVGWGNIPDPLGYSQDFDDSPPLYIARRARENR